MALQLGRFANTYGIKFKNITWLFLEDKDGKVGFDIKKDYQDDFIKGNNTLVLGNSNDYLEIKLFYLFKGFMAKVLGRYLFIMNAQEREKYPDDFITMDKEKGITTLKLKGYDHNLKEIGEFNITYDERNYQIRLSIEKLEKESGYAIIPAGEYTKDYQEMLSEMALLDDSFKETKKEDLKEDPRKMEDASSLKVKVMDKKANYLFDAAVLRKDGKEVQIMVDNIRDMHFSMKGVQNSLEIDNTLEEEKVFRLWEILIQKLVGNMALGNAREFYHIRKGFINLKDKTITIRTDGSSKNDDKMIINYDKDKITLEFRRSVDQEDYLRREEIRTHIMIATSGSIYRYLVFDFKELFTNLRNEFRKPSKESDYKLERRK